MVGKLVVGTLTIREIEQMITIDGGGETCNEQVSAKSKPVRGLCLMKINGEREAMKEVGRNDENPSTTTPFFPTDRNWKHN